MCGGEEGMLVVGVCNSKYVGVLRGLNGRPSH